MSVFLPELTSFSADVRGKLMGERSRTLKDAIITTKPSYPYKVQGSRSQTLLTGNAQSWEELIQNLRSVTANNTITIGV